MFLFQSIFPGFGVAKQRLSKVSKLIDLITKRDRLFLLRDKNFSDPLFTAQRRGQLLRILKTSPRVVQSYRRCYRRWPQGP